MSLKVGTFLSLVLLPVSAIPAGAQGSVGPLQEIYHGSTVISAARAGSLAYFTTIAPGEPYPSFIPGFLRSDGTLQGTFSIDPRGPVSPESQTSIQFADSLGGLLFFSCAKHATPGDRGLWRTDGTRTGTFPVTQGLSLAMDSGSGEPPVVLPIPERGLMFFSAGPRSASPDFELWATDGTPEGTRLVKDVNPEGPSKPRRMTVFDGRLFFFADTPRGRELWRSDGTPEGTVRVHDFPKKDFEIFDLIRAGGVLFVLQDTAPGLEVWRSDGTETGTESVLNLPQRLHQQLAAADRHLFLVVEDPGQTWNKEIWAIDGGTGEAVRVLQADTAQEIQMLAVGDEVAFSLEDDHGQEPWWSDGTPEGTHRIADLCPGPCGSLGPVPSFAGTYAGRAVLRADDGLSGVEPWLTDGTAAGTWRLGDLCPGECGSVAFTEEVNGWLTLLTENAVWISDGSPDGAWSVGSVGDLIGGIALPDRLVIAHQYAPTGFLSSLPVTAPVSPPGRWMESTRLPGFRFKAQIGPTVGRQEPACMARTLCVSAAAPGRSEVFLRVSGPSPDGHLWPTLIKLTTVDVGVWIVQSATGHLRHYRLRGTDPAASNLAGILDREGFLAAQGGLELATEGAKPRRDPQPPGRWIESNTVPGFRVQARLTSSGKSRILRKEPCIAETFCLSGATPGITELLVRVTGPRPNGYYWPMMARFAPATLEVWVQQRKTGKIRYYRLNPPPAGSSQLDGAFDRLGFKR